MYSEEKECMVFMAMFWQVYPNIARLSYHIPNGGIRTKASGARFKLMGVLKGAADYCIPVSRGIYHTLYIEMKRERDGVISPEQKNFIYNMRQNGHFADIANGAKEAFNILAKYINLKSGESMNVQYVIE